MSNKILHIEKIIHANGGLSALARKIGVSRQVVYNWSLKGVPANKVLILCELADHQVSPQDLRPDVFSLNENKARAEA